jgi:hypothetical protein
MTKAADLSALGSNVTTAGNLSSASTLTLQTNSTTALTINSSQNVGIGTTSPSSKLTVGGNPPVAGAIAAVGANSGISLALSDNVNSSLYVRNIAGGSLIGTDAGNALRFATNGNTDATERMRIDSSGNVGIGTTSPTAYSTFKTLAIQGGDTTNGGLIDLQNSDRSAIFQFYATSTSAVINQSKAFPLILNTNATERMRIDSAGNVGIGVTPSAWGSNFKVIESAGNSSAVYAAANVNGLRLTSNLYNDNTNFIYKTTGEAAVYAINTSIHQWFTAPSGTAGTTATLTERMRLSSAGGFSVGTTSDPGAGAIYATGNITAFFSDIRLKNNEGRIDNALDKVSKLSGIYYTTNETAKEYGYTDEARQVGVIAQEVKEVLPEIVKAAPFDLDENGKSKSGQDYMTVQYDKLVPLLIEAIKELKAEVDELKKGK